MARSLVIVESPAKAKTINKYLGRDYSVKASYGHVMDLPKKILGIDIDNEFEPTYEVIPGKTKVINELKKAAKESDAIYLAGDPDREGEAICAHLALQLGRNKTERKKIFRVMFNEITAKAIKAAFDKPAQVDMNLVDAQQARRVLDRIVGYKISPLLWDKVRRGLSAGRVQTVALRLIVERERDIRAFVPQEYWTIHALLDAGEQPFFEAKLVKHAGEDVEISNEVEAQRILAEAESAEWRVVSYTRKDRRRNPYAPFTTSKLQQEAVNRLGFTAKKTMTLAQRLYEGVDLGEEGSVALITYMRTDSVRVSADAVAEARDFILKNYSADHLPEKPNFYKSKKDAQDAHEAIRPTDVTRRPEELTKYLEPNLLVLYRLIWRRFVASQMMPAVYDQITVDVSAGEYLFRTNRSVLKFDGWLAAYPEAREEKEEEETGGLPSLKEGQTVRPEKMRSEQHFTEPPPRYTEGTLVKELEEKGIGRPSTYATIISTIVDREYVNKDQGRRLTPTMLGEKVSELLVKSFEDIFDVGFTARMEEELDDIEEGKLPWRSAVKNFYDRFARDLEQAKGEMESYKAGIKTGKKCEKCGKGEILERISRHGFFLGCDRYPECDFTQDIAPEPGGENVESEAGPEYCDNCGKEMTIKRGRFGPFLACTGYPECKTTRRLAHGTRKALQPDQLLDEKCPECGSQLVLKHGRFGEFTGCTAYPKCKFIRSKTLGIPCPQCETGELVERMARKGRMRRFYGCNKYPACDFTTPFRPIHEPCPKCGAKFVVEKHPKNGPAVRTCIKDGCDWEIPAPESAPAEAAAS